MSKPHSKKCVNPWLQCKLGTHPQQSCNFPLNHQQLLWWGRRFWQTLCSSFLPTNLVGSKTFHKFTGGHDNDNIFLAPLLKPVKNSTNSNTWHGTHLLSSRHLNQHSVVPPWISHVHSQEELQPESQAQGRLWQMALSESKQEHRECLLVGKTQQKEEYSLAWEQAGLNHSHL